MKNLSTPIALLSVVLCLFLSILFIPPPYRAILVTLAAFAGTYVVAASRITTDGPSLRWIPAAVAALFSLGMGAWLWTANFIYLIVGMLSIPVFLYLLVLGANYLRFPPYLWRPVSMFRANRIDEALRWTHEWIRDHPHDWRAILMRSELHMSRMQWAEAAEDARLAARLKPDLDEVQNHLGRSLVSLGLYEEAREAFSAAHRLKAHPIAMYNIALVDHRRGEFALSVAALKGITTPPSFGSPQYDLLALYYLTSGLQALGREAEAAEALERLRALARSRLKPGELAGWIDEGDKLPDHPGARAYREELADLRAQLGTQSLENQNSHPV